MVTADRVKEGRGFSYRERQSTSLMQVITRWDAIGVGMTSRFEQEMVRLTPEPLQLGRGNLLYSVDS